jgi:hypothetical protein
MEPDDLLYSRDTRSRRPIRPPCGEMNEQARKNKKKVANHPSYSRNVRDETVHVRCAQLEGLLDQLRFTNSAQPNLI